MKLQNKVKLPSVRVLLSKSSGIKYVMKTDCVVKAQSVFIYIIEEKDAELYCAV